MLFLFNKEKFRILFCIAIPGLFVSCVPLSKKIGEQKFKTNLIQQNEPEKLNGFYSNSPDSIIGGIKHTPYDGFGNFERLTILGQLFWNVPESAWRDSTGKYIEPKLKYVSIAFQSKRKATISLYQNDEFIFSKTIHGKFKNGYFYVRPKILILPIFPIVFGYNFERARIGKLENSLIIDYTVNRWGFALIAGSSDRGVSSSLYKQK